MSLAEIADNKWETESTKPPVVNLGGIASMFLMACFALTFMWMFYGSVMGIVTTPSPTKSALEAKLAAGQ